MDEYYYKICLEQKSSGDTLLFWKPKGNGYTRFLDEAGLYDKKSADETNKRGRDIALTEKQLSEIAEIYTVADCSMTELLNKKEELKE